MLIANNLGYTLAGRTLLAGVDLTLRPGEIVAVLGPNGAGKSTLLKLLCRQISPSTGTITWQGKCLSRWTLAELARQRAVLPQHSTIPFDFTALEIVLLGRSPHGDAAAQEQLAFMAMEWTECAHLADRVARTLSGGELQRVNLSRVLVQLGLGRNMKERLLLLDEPISNLDPAHQHGTLRVCRRMAECGSAVLVVLHDLNLAAQYSDRILLIQEGCPVEFGKPEQVLRPEVIRQVFDVQAHLAQNPINGTPVVFVAPFESEPVALFEFSAGPKQ